MAIEHITAFVEGPLDRDVMVRLFNESGRFADFSVQDLGSQQKLQERIQTYNQIAASGYPLLFLTDLDRLDCPLALISAWLPHGSHPNLIFRVAVRMVEAWLLADRINCAAFLHIPVNKLPLHPDDADHPKKVLLTLVKDYSPPKLRDALLPRDSTTKVGPGYNVTLGQFVFTGWKPAEGALNSPSLARAIHALDRFALTPVAR